MSRYIALWVDIQNTSRPSEHFMSYMMKTRKKTSLHQIENFLKAAEDGMDHVDRWRSWWHHQMRTFSTLLALCEEFTGDRWITPTKASNAELWCFLWYTPKQTGEQTLETPMILDAIVVIVMSLQCSRYRLSGGICTNGTINTFRPKTNLICFLWIYSHTEWSMLASISINFNLLYFFIFF